MVNSPALKILLVDDSSAVRESLRTVLLLEDNFEVVGEAESGRRAVEIARDLKPDVVVMDLEMPDGSDFDGIDACAEIKQQSLAKAVIILTIHADRLSRQRAKDAHCDFFIEKGTSSAELLKLLTQFQA
jgi:DNA-binding NarL/FixJ family response regulator